MPANDRPYTVHDCKEMITKDLGYCCPWLFLRLYKRDSIVANRLGVTRQRVNQLRQELKRGELKCLNSPRCMKKDELYIKENLPKA